MEDKILKKAKRTNRSLILVLLLLASLNIWAQTQQVEIPAPSDEEFQSADGVIVQLTQRPKNYELTGLDIIRIYNNDKTIWYAFSYAENSPVHFLKNEKAEFQPFIPFKRYGLKIRLKAESKNWYEVVVNEETQETKYTWKDDPVLGYKSLEGYIMMSSWIIFNTEKNPIREKPDGKIVKVEYPIHEESYKVRRFEGDWMLVEAMRTPNAIGWIRWRKDRKILIGYTLNNGIVPEQ